VFFLDFYCVVSLLGASRFFGPHPPSPIFIRSIFMGLKSHKFTHISLIFRIFYLKLGDFHPVRCLHLTVNSQWKVFIFTPTGGQA